MTISEHELQKQNRLINEKSPYLLQHAHNPVDWYPWGDEAFEKARREDKPVFLSIGYSTCHWCHVMERESFEDEEVAVLLNRDFVSIKVDREERPDIDAVYMSVCQGLTGAGGWPLTIFMTPDKVPFYAATYLPKGSRYGIPGMMELLPRLADLWKNRREEIVQSGNKIVSWLAAQERPGEKKQVGRMLIQEAYNHFQQTFDRQYGGFSSAPKFPSPHSLYFLLRYHYYTGNEDALRMVEKTLESMYRGGIYDHIGFGFARYSTDKMWLVPHFEKMLYDNALLAIAYLESFQVTGKKIYARVAREIFEYVLRDMTDSEGGFFSAEDADSEGEEGKFYTWKYQEILDVLGEESGKEFCDMYGVTQAGNFEGASIPNLLKQMIAENDRQRLEAARQKLFEYREKRIHPFKDDKILAAWNGFMIAAMSIAGRVFSEPRYIDAAVQAAEFIMNHMRDDKGRLMSRYRDGEARFTAYAQDYASLAWGFIELFQSAQQPHYLDQAIRLSKILVDDFWDEDKGGLFFYARQGEALPLRPREAYDGAVPSANSMAALNFLRLGRITGDNYWEGLGLKTLEAFSGDMERQPAAYTYLLISAMYLEYPGGEIVVAGRRESGDSKDMLAALASKFLPGTTVVFKDHDNPVINELAAYCKDVEMVDDKTTAYLCENYTCHAPVTGVEELLHSLESSVSGG